MNSLVLNKPSKNSTLDCADLLKMAERELSAFLSAVTELFGSEQAGHSAQDWLNELEAVNALPASTGEWRRITTKVAMRLANRVCSVCLN